MRIFEIATKSRNLYSSAGDLWQKILWMSLTFVLVHSYLQYKKVDIVETIKKEETAIYIGHKQEKFIRYEFETFPEGEILHFYSGMAIPKIKENLPMVGRLACIEYKILKYSDKTKRRFLDRIKKVGCD